MDKKIQESLMSIAGASHDERVKFGRQYLAQFVGGLKEGKLNDDQITKVIIAFTKLFISADKSCDYAEYELFRDITGIDSSYDEFYEATNGGSASDFVNSSLEFAKILTPDDRSALLCYGAALLGADGAMKDTELALYDRILNA